MDLFESVVAEGRWIGTEAPLDRSRLIEQWREKYLEAEDGCILLAEVDGDVVGLANLKEWIGIVDLRMVVHASHRRRGIGRALLTRSIEWAESAHAHKLALQVWPHNEGAIRLYESFGFEREGLLRRHYRRSSGEVWDSVIMGLVLEANDS